MFTHLHVHSNFSFNQGASSLERLVERAKELNMTALALTDSNGLYGAVPFYKLCRERGIRPILGAEVDDPSDPGTRVVLLARDRQGYSDISRLITHRRLDEVFSLPHAVAENSGHYFVLTRSVPLLERLANLGVEGLHGEVVAWGDREEMRRGAELVRICRKSGLGFAATNDVHFERPSGFPLHRLLRAIALLRTVGSLQPAELSNRGAWLKSDEEMRRMLGCLPEAFETTQRIAEACDCPLELGRFVFPRFPLPAGVDSARHLRELTQAGLLRRYSGEDHAARKQMDYELSVIGRLGFVDYFLVVYDLVCYARRRRLPMVGRGSAANSLVAYCLGITHVDPLKHNLFFERFLNPERKTPPDIDLDFGTSRRDGILDWIYERYGRDRVAMICTTNCYSTRSAVREVGKAMGLSEAQVNEYTRGIPHMHVSTLARLKEMFPECSRLETEAEPYRTILRAADRIIGYPRHLSIHCGGVVITPKPLWNWVPLERASKGFVITQMDMHPIEDLGLVKIDILGNRSLDVLPDTLAALERQGIAADVEDYSMIYADDATRRMLENGETMGCFYIESPAMRSLLKKLRVHDFEGLTAASSVIRPGVAESGMMRQYIERHHHPDKAVFLHPRLRELLRDTHGVMVYQEDVIRVAHFLGGMSLGEADLFRRAMSGKMRSREAMQLTQEGFFASCRRQGLDDGTIAELYRQIASFAGYSFCKAHSASFALLSFQVAWLKAHYPAEFMAAVISNGGGFYGPWAYISEAQRLGLRVLPPDVNLSEPDYTGQKDWIRIGLRAIKGLTSEGLESLVAAREAGGHFKSLGDLMARTKLGAEEIQRLIQCGAADCFGLIRPQLMWHLRLYFQQARRAGRSLFPQAEAQATIPLATDYTPQEKLMAELEAFDFTLSHHPLEFYQEMAAKEGAIHATRLREHVGKRVRMLGWKIASKRTVVRRTDRLPVAGGLQSEAASQRSVQGHHSPTAPSSSAATPSFMMFLSMEDLHGTFEVVMFPDCYRQYAHCVAGYGPFLVEGRVDEEFGVPSLTARSVRNLRFGTDHYGCEVLV
jgi:DNA-directed DNA polymerase III PolC